jgi:hypothetical protein
VTVSILEYVAGVPDETSLRPHDAELCFKPRGWLRSLEQAIIMFD